MEVENPPFPYFTWDCANDLEDRFKKTLYHGGKRDCMRAVSPAALTDLAVSIYVASAQSPKRKLTAGYIGSVAKRLSINPCTMILGLLYCERLRQVNPEYLNKISSSDLFVVSLIISSKFLNDEGEDDEIFNEEWAEAGGLAVRTVNQLEWDFLGAIQWKVYVGPQEFLLFCNKLETRIAMKHGLLRGWFSYTDLTRILAQMHYLETVKSAVNSGLQVVLGCTLMYGLSLGVILSSALCLSVSYTESSSTQTQDTLHPYTNRPITRARTTQQINTCDDAMNTRITNYAASRNITSAMPNALPSKQQVHLIAQAAHRKEYSCNRHSQSSNWRPRNELGFGALPLDVRWFPSHRESSFENIAPSSKMSYGNRCMAKYHLLSSDQTKYHPRLSSVHVNATSIPGIKISHSLNCIDKEGKRILVHPRKKTDSNQDNKLYNPSLLNNLNIDHTESKWKELSSIPLDSVVQNLVVPFTSCIK